MTVSRRVLLMIGSAFGLVHCSGAHTGGGTLPPPLTTKSGRKAASAAVKALLYQTRNDPIARPSGQSTEVSGGRFAYRGMASFKMPYRVMTGTASTLEWANNKLTVTGKKGHTINVRVDETNSQISQVHILGS